jgi:putative ABC transport system permease protein
MNEYMLQTFGPTVQSIKMVSYAALFIALFITFLITLLFMKMLLAKDRSSIATLKVLGFTSRDISNQFMVRAIFVAFIGIVLGTILANTLGEAIAGMVIAQLGAASFQFRINPITAYILSPLMMMCLVVIAAMFSTAKVEQIKLSEIRKE